MPDNGSGTYILPAGQPVVTGTVISSTTENTLATDLANALTNRVTRDGQSPATANLPMGGFRHTGASDGVSATDYATLGQLTTASGLSTGFKNKLINGDMRIDQLSSGASKNYIAGAALSYGPDQWYGYCTGANVTGNQLITSSRYAYRFTGAASVTAIGYGQRIERDNVMDLANSTVTLSAMLANSLLTSVGWAVYSANTTNAFGTLAAPTRTLISSGTFTVTATLTKYSASITIPAGTPTGLEVVLTVGAQTSGTWTITGVQLEPGATATNFEYRPYGTELVLAQRYYESGTYLFTMPISNASITASYLTPVDFKVTKFAVPTIVSTNDQGGAAASSIVGVDSMIVGRSDVVANRNNSGTWTATARIP